jgi:hypothetical protein
MADLVPHASVPPNRERALFGRLLQGTPPADVNQLAVRPIIKTLLSLCWAIEASQRPSIAHCAQALHLGERPLAFTNQQPALEHPVDQMPVPRSIKSKCYIFKASTDGKKPDMHVKLSSTRRITNKSRATNSLLRNHAGRTALDLLQSQSVPLYPLGTVDATSILRSISPSLVPTWATLSVQSRLDATDDKDPVLARRPEPNSYWATVPAVMVRMSHFAWTSAIRS